MDAAKQFGLTVRELREERGLSQEALASLAGVHRTMISHLENGQRNPRFTTIVKVAEALGVHPGRLFD